MDGSQMIAIAIGLAVIAIVARVLRRSKPRHPTRGDVVHAVDATAGVDAEEYTKEVLSGEDGVVTTECQTPVDERGFCETGFKVNPETGCCDECAFKPSEDGTCPTGFVPDDQGCCTQINAPPPNVPLETTVFIAKEIILPELAQAAGHKMAKIMAKRGPGLIAKLSSRLTAVQGSKVASKVVAKQVGRMVGKMVKKMALKVGLGVAKIGTKMAAFASAGPVGAVLAVFEVFSMLLDVLDPAGYENFTTNNMNENARMVAEVAMYTALKEQGCDYPMIFPVQLAFPKEFAEADQCVIGTLYGEAFEALGDADLDTIGGLMDEAIDALPDTVTQQEIDAALDSVIFPDDIVARMGDIVVELMNSDPVRRDRMRYDELKRLLPAHKRSHVTLYPSYSKINQVGITLTERGVIEWNKTHKDEWFKYNDIFEEITPPDDYEPSLVAIFSDTYYVLNMDNPGTKEHPNMLTKRFPKRVAMASPIGHVVAFCEKPRHKGIMGSGTKLPGAGVDPKEHGVFFDSTKGLCRYTYPYCNRMGLEYTRGKNGTGDCKPYPGQDVAEVIFGKTLTRAFIRFGQTFERAFGKFPQCAPDEIQRGIECFEKPPEGRAITTPGGYLHGKICPPGSTDSGTTCYYGRGAGRIPDKKPCPNGQRDDGTSCWIDTYGRGAGYAVKIYGRGAGRIPDKKPCPEGMRDDGTSCWVDTYGRGAGRIPDKKSCPQGTRDDGTSCWVDTYGRGAGRIPDKRRCPAGMRDDGTSCWKDSYGRGAGRIPDKSTCPKGTRDDGTSCWADTKKCP